LWGSGGGRGSRGGGGERETSMVCKCSRSERRLVGCGSVPSSPFIIVPSSLFESVVVSLLPPATDDPIGNIQGAMFSVLVSVADVYGARHVKSLPPQATAPILQESQHTLTVVITPPFLPPSTHSLHIAHAAATAGGIDSTDNGAMRKQW
jgi:hypothetical protein